MPRYALLDAGSQHFPEVRTEEFNKIWKFGFVIDYIYFFNLANLNEQIESLNFL